MSGEKLFNTKVLVAKKILREVKYGVLIFYMCRGVSKFSFLLGSYILHHKSKEY